MVIKTDILPKQHQFFRLGASPELNYKAICVFLATGFFMDDDTYYKDEVCLKSAHDYEIDNNGYVENSKLNFSWHHSPKDISFKQALEEYIHLFTKIIKEQSLNKDIILPLSGGLDSRSQAMILHQLETNVHSISYSFKNGYPEHKIAERIANHCDFTFSSYQINEGYLWDDIEKLANLNQCYSEFTNSRQMAILDEMKAMKGEFSLGHWGDVLFDRGCPDYLEPSEMVTFVYKKIVKPSGYELANDLWREWGRAGDFKEYLVFRIEKALSQIKIDQPSAKIRAFKTMQWAHRWTTVNLQVFKAARPIHMPYYDNRMIEFICSIPEKYLADRKLQLEHIKQNKSLASITWHAHRPFNVNTYKFDKLPYNVPYRIKSKLNRVFRRFSGNRFIQRNFELQFLGTQNDENLRHYLYKPEFHELVPKKIIDKYHKNFIEKDYVYYAHSLSMLLTLSLWKSQHSRL